MGTRLYVGNLAYSTTEESLRRAFEGDGRKVASVFIAMDRETGRPRGFAFVEMATQEDMTAAIKAMDGQVLDGRPLRVNEAQERQPRRGGPPPGGMRGGNGRPPMDRPAGGGDDRGWRPGIAPPPPMDDRGASAGRGDDRRRRRFNEEDRGRNKGGGGGGGRRGRDVEPDDDWRGSRSRHDDDE